MDRDDYAPLEARLGYRFADIEHLKRALTHRSFLNEHPAPGRADNERLEFLGDAVLNLAIAQIIMDEYPAGREGVLSRLRASIVSEAGLSEVARALSLGEWLFLGRGEEHSGGRHKPSLLADACEAVIAAVYQDGGFDTALSTVHRLFGDHVRAAFEDGRTDFKTRLQERSQGLLRIQPRYALVGTTGPDHDKTFEVALLVGERELSRGVGRSKKEAEQRAAERGLPALEATAVALDTGPVPPRNEDVAAPASPSPPTTNNGE